MRLTNAGIAGTTTAFVDFNDLTFPSVTLSLGAAIYKSTGGGNELVLVFGGNKTAITGDFIHLFSFLLLMLQTLLLD